MLQNPAVLKIGKWGCTGVCVCTHIQSSAIQSSQKMGKPSVLWCMDAQAVGGLYTVKAFILKERRYGNPTGIITEGMILGKISQS